MYVVRTLEWPITRKKPEFVSRHSIPYRGGAPCVLHRSRGLPGQGRLHRPDVKEDQAQPRMKVLRRRLVFIGTLDSQSKPRVAIGHAEPAPAYRIPAEATRGYAVIELPRGLNPVERLLQDEQAPPGIAFELREADSIPPDDSLDIGGRAVSCLQQDDLRRRAPGKTQTGEIFVLCQERETVVLRIAPYNCVRSSAQTGRANVD